MKYVCMAGNGDKLEIITFPKNIDHDCMAEVLGRIKNQTHGNWERVFREPISAGFVDRKGNCYGESATLGLVSREHEDTELLAEQAEAI